MGSRLAGVVSAIVAVACLVAFVRDDSTHKSAGGPPYNTNAPGEKTCGGSEGSSNSCHSGGIPDNSGPGTPDILFSGGSVYVPGQTYTVTPTISHPTRNRFGFQITSLKDAGDLFTGSIVLLDSSRTQTQQPTYGSYQDRVFVMHQLPGTYPFTQNVGEWSYLWTAPSSNVGNISFYACFLAANNNNTNDGGDETYWKKITIAPSAVDINEPQADIHMSLYPNPCSEYLYLTFYLYEASSLKCELVDLQGQLVKTLINERSVTGNFQAKILLGDVARGTYYVRNCVGQRQSTKKVIVL